MTLEEFVAELNILAFWKEFTFAENKFAPRPGQELELADNLVWLGRHAFILQLKERTNETENPAAEEAWFRKRVMDKATRQVRDTLRFLEEHPEIQVTNERGHPFEVRRDKVADLTKVVVYLAGAALPDAARRTRYHLSNTAGFIHVVAAHDYLGILETLRVPEDIRRYFVYREQVAPKIVDPDVDETDIMGAFLAEEAIPSSSSREILERFVQDLDSFDLSSLLGNLHDHIDRSDQPQDYYGILLEFASVPRSVWREVKLRFMKSLEAAQKGEFVLPFRLTFPATDCTFMIAPLPPEIPAAGSEGEEARTRGLTNLTFAAMYDAKTSTGVGIQISKDGEHIQIDWSLIKAKWKQNSEMDAKLAENSPFRPTSEKRLDSFFIAEVP